MDRDFPGASPVGELRSGGHDAGDLVPGTKQRLAAMDEERFGADEAVGQASQGFLRSSMLQRLNR